jgi:hypothetical protein
MGKGLPGVQAGRIDYRTEPWSSLAPRRARAPPPAVRGIEPPTARGCGGGTAKRPPTESHPRDWQNSCCSTSGRRRRPRCDGLS